MTLQDLHILIAENDDFQRNIVINLLKSLGVKTFSEARNGQEALTLLHTPHETKINLVISEIKMPSMDGMAFLRFLGQEKNDVEIIILSSLDKKLMSAIFRISEIYNLNLLGALDKPTGLKQLKAMLSKRGKPKPKPQSTSNSNTVRFTLAEIMEGIRLKQFTPYLQPKVDLKTGLIVGAEALARWIHPEHGLIPPYAFISILEENNKIDHLTFLMLKECASIYSMFLKKSENIHIAVNLSLVSLNDLDIAQRITSTVIEHGGDPKNFTLEITESTAMTDAPIALENLARLSINGFILSVDDYGTGYSNLQQLTRINFAELKLDRSLVHNFSKNDDMRIITSSNVEMAHKLNMKCVAEGIETQEDWEQLRKIGCDIGQGYLIAKPLNLIDFYHFLTENNGQPIKAMPKTIRHFLQSKQQTTVEKKILVIEPDGLTRNAILKILVNLGYQKTIVVENTKSAIDLFESHQFDLIFTDLFMPDVNGLDLIKQIRTNKTLARPNTRIIVLSGLTQVKALGIAMALNVNDIVVKPLISDVIDSKIKRILAEPSQTLNPLAYEPIHTEM